MLEWFNSAVAFIVVGRLIAMADSMNGSTRHCFRLAVAVLALVLVAFALWPLYGEWPQWADSALIIAIGLYVFTERRARQAARALKADSFHLAP